VTQSRDTMMNEARQQLHVVVRGRVQGVGFRAATERMAREAGLCGWVRNLPDGAVEAEFVGTRAQLEEALRWCGHGPRFARVDAVESVWGSTPGEYDAFAIRG